MSNFSSLTDKALSICSPQIGLSKLSNAGGEVYDYYILKHLAELGINIQLILPNERPYSPIPGVSIRRASFSKGRYANFVFAKVLLQEYQIAPFDILRIHSPYYVGLAGLFFRFCHPDVSIVVHHHHLEKNILHYTAINICAKYADFIITDSEFSRLQLLNNIPFISPERIVVIYSGIDESFKPQNVGDFLEKNKLIDYKLIVYVGSLIPRKNLIFLLQVFKEVNKIIPKTRLIIVGDGPQRSILQKAIIEMKLSSEVLMTGFLSGMEKLCWLNAADVFISTSKMEGFGLNVAEAMACEKPVVVSRAGAFPEIVKDKVTGFVVSLDDQIQFVRLIAQLLGNPELRLHMGKAGRKRVLEHFQWNNAAEKVKEIYKEAILRRKKNENIFSRSP